MRSWWGFKFHPVSQLYKLFTNIRHGDQNLFHGQGQMCLESNQELILFLEKGGFMVDHHILVDSCLFSVYFLGVTMPSLTSMPQYKLFPLPGMPSQWLLISETFLEIWWLLECCPWLGVPPKLFCNLYSKHYFLPLPYDVLYFCALPSLLRLLVAFFFMSVFS